MADTKCVLLIYTLLLTLFSAYCQNVCITNDLEGDFEGQFSNCPYTILNINLNPGTYSSSGLDPPHPNSTSFIIANSRGNSMGCVRHSHQFTVTPGSTFQVNFYVNAPEYSLVARLYNPTTGQSISNGLANIRTHPNGWNVMETQYLTSRPSAVVTMEFEVFFPSNTPTGSSVIIDSYRYMSNRSQLENCKIYPDVVDTEITTTAQPENSTQKPDNSGECSTTEQPVSSEESTTTEQPDISEEDTEVHPVDPEGGDDSDEETDVDNGNPFRCINTCVCNCQC